MIIIYSKPNCPYCVQAKNFLIKRGLVFEEIHVDINQEKDTTLTYIIREDLMKLAPTARAVPVIFVDGIYIGGFTELLSLKECVK